MLQQCNCEDCEIDLLSKDVTISSTHYNEKWLKDEIKIAYKYVSEPSAKLRLKKKILKGNIVSGNKLNPKESCLIRSQYYDVYSPIEFDNIENTVFNASVLNRMNVSMEFGSLMKNIGITLLNAK